MRRRQVLAVTTAGGCLGGNAEAPETTTSTTETTTAEAPVVGEPLPSDCPVLGDDVRRVVCYPDTDAPLSMTPSAIAASLPDASVSFTLANETETTFSTNFYAWRLHKRVDGEWYYIAPSK